MESSLYADGNEYDRIRIAVDSGSAEVAFFASCASPGAAILELGCGTGRLAIPLAQRGHAVTGLDNAPDMLRVAREKAARAGVAPAFVAGDFRRFALGRVFALVCLPNNALTHLLHYDDLAHCLASVRTHVTDGGRFVIDTFNPSPHLLDRAPGVRYPVSTFVDADGRTVVHTESVHYDAATQINHITWHFARDDGETERRLALRMWYPQELEALLRLGGFGIEARYGDVHRAPFAGSSPQQVLVCRPL